MFRPTFVAIFSEVLYEGYFYKDLKPTYKYKKKLRGLSPQANYTDRAAAAGRRS